MVYEILRVNNKISSDAIAQLIECLAGEQENPGSIPRKGEFFFT